MPGEAQPPHPAERTTTLKLVTGSSQDTRWGVGGERGGRGKTVKKNWLGRGKLVKNPK